MKFDNNTITKSNNSKFNTIFKKGLFFLLTVGLAFLAYCLLPSGESGLSENARLLAALFIAALVLWATELIPIAATALLVLAVGPLMGVFNTMKEASVGFTSPVVYFVIASFIISIAVQKSGLTKRIALWMMSKSGTETKRILLIFMGAAAVLSAFMSNVPSCAVVMSLAIPILDQINAHKCKSNFGKAVMIGIPIAAFCGGVATPAGSSPNILAITLLKDLTGIEVTFIQWMAIGIPISIIMTLISWLVLVKVFPPEIKSIGSMNSFLEEQKALGKWNNAEKKTVIILCLLFILWVASSWVKFLDIPIVTIIAACIMFFPGIKLFSWEDVQNGTGWDSVLIIGTVTSLGLASTQNGLSTWIVNNMLGGIGNMHLFLALIIISLFIIVIHLPIPINPTIIATVVPAIIILASSSGINPAIYSLSVGFAVSAAFLLPLDAVPLVTYSKGYYKMLDFFIPGIIISIIWAIVSTASLYFIAPLLGFR